MKNGWFKRMGRRWFPLNPNRFKVPSCIGWWVCINANAGANPPDGTSAVSPPYAPYVTIFENLPIDRGSGNVDVFAIVDPAVPVECALLTAGVPGAYTPMVHNNASPGDYHLTLTGVAPGTHAVRIRPINSTVQSVDSGNFNVA